MRRACREDRTNCSTTGAVSGWVYRRHPPAMLRRTRPDPRSSSSPREALAERSTVAAVDVERLREHRGRRSARPRRRTAPRGRACPSRTGTVVRVIAGLTAFHCHLDLSERLPPAESSTFPSRYSSRMREEPHDHVDPVLAVRDQVAERAPGRPSAASGLADGRHRLGDRVADRRHVGEVERRGRPQELGRQREPGPRLTIVSIGSGYRCENSGPGPTSRAKKPASSSRRRASSTATLRNAASSMRPRVGEVRRRRRGGPPRSSSVWRGISRPTFSSRSTAQIARNHVASSRFHASASFACAR